ncbi:DNA recombination protein RmuC [bacterium]|jgi:DNA recombination protein RmuC|nr:DNA recombination protein RmuC [bacterium]MDP6756279.1 DNA recombination protein RmuC [Patescibacteria group bacterium]|tara:strand:+ start:20017 stop:21108 length:1092 start_codon:yes stop_codon:yes gene_type:complete
MNTSLLIIIIFVLMAAFTAVVYFLMKKLVQSKKPDEGANQAMQLLQNQLNDLTRTLDNKLGESTKLMQAQFGQSSKVIQGITGQSHQILKDVTERLTKLDETNKQVAGVGDQIRSLEGILKNPKQRGVLGEYYLESVLKNVLPPGSFQMQYKFKDGEIVDAVVYVGDKIVPVDSKFSLENYNRIVEEDNPAERERLEKVFKNDLKARIDETSKYIRPNENTMEFAFMFIPSEGIYYDLLINKVGAVKISTEDLIEYAFKQKHVIIVSPTSFLAYLQTVLQGMRALQIEKDAHEIRKRVELLGKHVTNYEEYMRKLGGHLSTTVNSYNTSYKELSKIDKDVMKITDRAESGVQPELIEGPKDEE